MVGDGLAFRQLRKRTAFGLQIIDQLVAGADDGERTRVAAGRQAIFLKVAAGDIAFKPDIAEFEDRAGRNRNDHGYRSGMIEHRIGRQAIHILAGNGDLDDAAITGVFIKRRDQPVPVVSCLYQKAKIAGGRLVLVGKKKRTVFQAVFQGTIGVRGIERDGVFDGVDNLDLGFFRTPEAHAEQFEGKGITGKRRIQGERHSNRKRGASFPIRNTCLRVSSCSSHKLLYG